MKIKSKSKIIISVILIAILQLGVFLVINHFFIPSLFNAKSDYEANNIDFGFNPGDSYLLKSYREAVLGKNLLFGGIYWGTCTWFWFWYRKKVINAQNSVRQAES